MAKTALDDLLDRLEVRRMSRGDYRARWCPCCLRTELRDPFVMLHPGGDGSCHQPILTGTISECIASLRELRAKS